jgi:hypothetical protein
VFFPRRQWAEVRQAIIDEIPEVLVEPRRHRRNHRGVKKKMSSYPLVNRCLDSKWRKDPAELITVIRPKCKKRDS